MGADQYTVWRRALERRRAPAVQQAERLLEQDEYDAAERTVLSVDDSIYGSVAIAKMYRARLVALAACGKQAGTAADKPAGGAVDAARLEALFRRAWYWAQRCYPDPHTADEAEEYTRSRTEVRAELVELLGYDPREE